MFATFHTESDLADLIRAVDYERGELEAWPSPSPLWAEALSLAGSDWLTFRPQALASLTAPDALQVVAPCGETWWRGVLAFVERYRLIDRELRLATGGAGPAYADMPQATREDFDLEAFKFSDWVIRKGPGLLGDALKTLALLYFGAQFLGGFLGARSASSRRRRARAA